MVLEAVLFDLGGTLVHHSKETNVLIKHAHHSMTDYLLGKGLLVTYDEVARVSDEIYKAYAIFAEKSYIELDARDIYPAILYRLGVEDYCDEDLIVGAVNSFYRPILDDYHVYRDVKPLLRWLKKKNLKLGLISNNHSTDYHLSLLEKSSLGEYFDFAVVSSKLGIRKPHKRIFLYCLDRVGAKPEDSVFVGDHPHHDIQGSKNAGMRCIWVKRKETEEVPIQPDWIIQSIRQVEEIVNSLI